MMAVYTRFLILTCVLLGMLSTSEASKRARCAGSKKYKVTFHMRWTRNKFGSTVPKGAILSPLTAAAHSGRFSPFANYAYATEPVEMVAESGNNAKLKKMLEGHTMVGDMAALSAPTQNDGAASVMLTLDADKGFTQVSAIGMLAPTPDWITFINNVDLCRLGYWSNGVRGNLYGWDAGTEETPGKNQEPQQNIYRLQSPRYPAYQRYPVGYFHIKAI